MTRRTTLAGAALALLLVAHTGVSAAAAASGSRTANDDDDGMPLLGQLSIALLVCVLALAALSVCGYVCRCLSRWCPTPGAGAALLAEAPQRQGQRRAGLAVAAALALALKLAALAVDRWSSQSYSGAATMLFGLTRERLADQQQSYALMCQRMSKVSDVHSHDVDMCHTLRASGAATLALGVLSCVGSLLLLLRALATRCRAEQLNSGADDLRAWRCAGVTLATALAAPLAWVCSAHLVLIEFWDVADNNRGPELAVSTYLMAATCVVDAVALYLARHIVLYAQGEGVVAQSHFAVVGAAGLAYQPLESGAPAQALLGHPAAYHVAPPQVLVYQQGAQQSVGATYPVYGQQTMAQQQMPPAYAPPQTR